jgi:hypothetical protein
MLAVPSFSSQFEYRILEKVKVRQLRNWKAVSHSRLAPCHGKLGITSVVYGSCCQRLMKYGDPKAWQSRASPPKDASHIESQLMRKCTARTAPFEGCHGNQKEARELKQAAFTFDEGASEAG